MYAPYVFLAAIRLLASEPYSMMFMVLLLCLFGPAVAIFLAILALVCVSAFVFFSIKVGPIEPVLK